MFYLWVIRPKFPCTKKQQVKANRYDHVQKHRGTKILTRCFTCKTNTSVTDISDARGFPSPWTPRWKGGGVASIPSISRVHEEIGSVAFFTSGEFLCPISKKRYFLRCIVLEYKRLCPPYFRFFIVSGGGGLFSPEVNSGEVSYMLFLSTPLGVLEFCSWQFFLPSWCVYRFTSPFLKVTYLESKE